MSSSSLKRSKRILLSIQDAIAKRSYRDSDLFLSLLEPKQDDVILDVGGGTGRISEIVAKISDEVFSLEPSEEKVEFAQRVRPQVKSFISYAEAIPFPDNYFDKVFVIGSFHHFQDQDKAIEEMKKVTKKTGRIVIQEVDPSTRRGKMLSLLENRILKNNSKFYTPSELRSKLEEHDLEVIEMVTAASRKTAKNGNNNYDNSKKTKNVRMGYFIVARRRNS
jgi:ubiquinone/menaquinone biosynthesis C-methylase UbiE